MNCDMIKDLIPLCSEGLCSDESRKAIEEHIKTCESCRLLYEQIPKPKTTPPAEDVAMKKVNRKLKKMSLKQIILAVLLIGVLGGISFLSYNQITKRQGCISFETIFQSIEVRKIGKMIANQDFETYVDSISVGQVESLNQLQIINSSREKDIELLKESYQAELGSKKVTKVKSHSFYDENIRGNSIYSFVHIFYDDGTTFDISFIKGVDGLYKSLDAAITDNEDNQFINTISYVNYHDLIPSGVIERLIMKRSDSILYSNRFAMQYRDSVLSGSKAFRDAGYTFTNVSLSPAAYDSELDCIRYTITLTAQDNKGTAIAQAPLLLDDHGLTPPTSDQVQVYSKDCTPALETALLHFFG
ncbi:MAG: zf-HC2 domain-containing protein [Ruminococcus sp.]|nr:zf-HC2 domain-containing protein [Ruminococcus sp.]